jgi:lipopolysaccharide transport system permease protein
MPDPERSRAPEAPIVIEPRSGWVSLELRELWRYRELAIFLALRDVMVRYKQSLLGIAWVVLQPLLTMVVFTFLFRALLGADRMPAPEGVPYAVSTYCALVPWQLFARALSASSDSLAANQALVTRVYFPRLIHPLAPILAALVDFSVAFAVLALLMIGYGIAPGAALLALPAFVLLAVATALALSLWLSALNALYRDVRHAVPFVAQLWMFLTPVVYDTGSLLGGAPGWLASIYALNPMVGVVDGFRWALLGTPSPPWATLVPSVVVVSILLVGGAFYFRRMERVFADVV